MTAHLCAACGSPIILQSRFSHFVTCLYCGSLNYKEGSDLKTMSGVTLAQNFSVLQCGTTMTVPGASDCFTLIGRLVADCQEGAWNEWFCIDVSGNYVWLSESFGYYNVLNVVENDQETSFFKALTINQTYVYKGTIYYLQSIDRVVCNGVEGELPVDIHLTKEWLSLDFKSHSNAVLFINVDDTCVQTYAGYVYDFDDLKFGNMRSL
jgi:Domain of unknown function (DUF4178)